MIWDMEMLVHMVWVLYLHLILIEFLKMVFVSLMDIQLQLPAHPVDMQFSGEYPWRNQRAQILPGNAPLLFDISKETLPSLQKANYKTAIIGKWHLGLGDENLDWNQSISPGPNDIGFDYSFILASTNDRVPSVCQE